jgi:XRE family transcriptional regulator, aerobic/anaerobic benzoate catabolism transcriptional regulator
VSSHRVVNQTSAAPDGAGDRAYLSAVGERVRNMRASRGLSRRTLAQGSGVSERYLASLESGRGNASILLLRQIAAAMGVTVEALARSRPEASTDLTLLHQWVDHLDEADARRALRVLRAEFAARPERRRRQIALIGLRGAGKTTLGSALAARRDAPFVELDREIESAAGASLSEVFMLYGQTAYRRYERRALETLLARDDAFVVATGGGIVAEPETFDLLRASCFVVWLKATPEEHMARVVAQGDKRPMAGNREAMDDLRRILERRDALYRRADATVDTSGKSVSQSLRQLERVIRAAANSPDAGRARDARTLSRTAPASASHDHL